MFILINILKTRMFNFGPAFIKEKFGIQISRDFIRQETVSSCERRFWKESLAMKIQSAAIKYLMNSDFCVLNLALKEKIMKFFFMMIVFEIMIIIL